MDLFGFTVLGFGARALLFDNIIDGLLRRRRSFFFFLCFLWRLGLSVLEKADFCAFEDMYAHEAEQKKENQAKRTADRACA